MIKLVFLFKSIVRLIIVLIIARSTSLNANGAETIDPPEMWLTLHTPEDAPDKRQLEPETDFVIEDDVDRVDVTCEADYPITLKIPYPRTRNVEEISQAARISNYRISDWDDDALMPENIKFKSVTEFHLINFLGSLLSLNITCVPVDVNIKFPHASVHIYWKGRQSTHSIENQGATLQIPAKPNSNLPLILPCRPAKPNMTVVLEKKTSNTNPKQQFWNKLNSSANHVTFDPKFGFTFQKKPQNQSNFGLYRCLIEETNNSTGKHNKSPFVIFNVTKSTSSSLYEHDRNFVHKSILKGNASVVYVPNDVWGFTYADSITCCSGINDKPPKIYVTLSYNPLMAQITRNSILKDIATGKKSPIKIKKYRFKDCDKAYATQVPFSMFIVCRGHNIDFVEEFAYVFYPRKPNSRSHVPNKSFKINWSADDDGKPVGHQNRIIPATQFLATADLKRAPVSQKIMLTVLRRAQGARSSPLWTPQYFCDKQGISGKLPGNSVDLKEYDRDCNYEGEEMIFMCLGGKIFYSNGGYLRLSWKNGTKTFLKPTRKDYTIMPCFGPARGIGGFVDLIGNARLGYTDFTAEVKYGRVVANPEMASVECLMPRWDATEWDTVSKNLTVLPSLAPKFAEKENEVVNFTTGEKWKRLICSVKQGIPLPTVAIFNDDVPLKTVTYANKFKNELLPGNDAIITSYRDNENELTVIITFPIVKSNHQGIYQCEASNVKRTVTRTIKVSVIDEPSTTNKGI